MFILSFFSFTIFFVTSNSPCFTMNTYGSVSPSRYSTWSRTKNCDVSDASNLFLFEAREQLRYLRAAPELEERQLEEEVDFLCLFDLPNVYARFVVVLLRKRRHETILGSNGCVLSAGVSRALLGFVVDQRVLTEDLKGQLDEGEAVGLSVLDGELLDNV